jgi:hypothetical protein
MVGSLLASILGLLLAAAVQYALEYVGLGEALGKSDALLLYAPLSVLAVGAWRSASRRGVTGILANMSIFFSLSVTLLLIGSMFFYAAFQA